MNGVGAWDCISVLFQGVEGEKYGTIQTINPWYVSCTTPSNVKAEFNYHFQVNGVQINKTGQVMIGGCCMMDVLWSIVLLFGRKLLLVGP